MAASKITKTLGVLVLIAGLSYGVYEGISNYPSESYFYNKIPDSYLLENFGVSSLTETTDSYKTNDELSNKSENKNLEQLIIPSSTPVVNTQLQGVKDIIETQDETKTIPELPKQINRIDIQNKQNTVDSSTYKTTTNQEKSHISQKDNTVQIASSHGLIKVTDYESANKSDPYDENESSSSKPKTYVEEENPEYIKDLWNNSIAIKHRKYWNLAPIGHDSWERQFALVKKRFYVHAEPQDSEVIYETAFGNFTINPSKAQIQKFDYKEFEKNPNRRMYYLNAENLANVCYYQLSLTSWGSWFRFGRKRYWSILWDFCSKESVRDSGVPEEYWYHKKGERAEAILDEK